LGLEEVLYNVELSELGENVVRHDLRVNEVAEEMSRRDSKGTYKLFVYQYCPKEYRGVVGTRREHDLLRTVNGRFDSVFEVKTRHHGYSWRKAKKQLAYAHIMNRGTIDTFYVSWRKSDNSRIVRPVWSKKDDYKRLLEEYK